MLRCCVNGYNLNILRHSNWNVHEEFFSDILTLEDQAAPGSDYLWMKHHIDKEWNPHFGKMKNLRFYYNVMINELIICLLKISKYVLQCKKRSKIAICVQLTEDSEHEMRKSYRLPETLIKLLLTVWCSDYDTVGHDYELNMIKSLKLTTEQSPSAEINSCSVPQEILRLSGNQNLHYLVHNTHNLSLFWTRRLHFTPYIFKICFNIFSSMHRSLEWSLFFRCSH